MQFSDKELEISDTGDYGAQNFNLTLNYPQLGDLQPQIWYSNVMDNFFPAG